MAEGEWVDGRLVHDDLAHHRPAPNGDRRQHPLRRSVGSHSSSSELNLGSLDALPGARRRRDSSYGGSSSMGSVGSRRRSDLDDVRRGRNHSDMNIHADRRGSMPAGRPQHATPPGNYSRRESAASMASSGESSLWRKNNHCFETRSLTSTTSNHP